MTHHYGIKEIYWSMQGEGEHMGRPTVFCRFTGCNMWSGQEKHRAKHADKSDVHCSTWCDTDFINGELLRPEEIVQRLLDVLPVAWRDHVVGRKDYSVMVVFTGGEPLLQLDHNLIRMIKEAGSFYLAVETNGATAPKEGVIDELHWVCVSPKVKPERLVLRACDELKIPYPYKNYKKQERREESTPNISKKKVLERVNQAGHTIVPESEQRRSIDPADYEGWIDAKRLSLLPLWSETEQERAGADASVEKCMEWLDKHPGWRLCPQMHKYLRVP